MVSGGKVLKREYNEPNMMAQGRTGFVALDRAIYHLETDDFVGESSRWLKFVLLLPLSTVVNLLFFSPPRRHYYCFSKVNLGRVFLPSVFFHLWNYVSLTLLSLFSTLGVESGPVHPLSPQYRAPLNCYLNRINIVSDVLRSSKVIFIIFSQGWHLTYCKVGFGGSCERREGVRTN